MADHYSEPIDLLVSDVVMPGMFGPELAARLSLLRKEMRILFISGHTEGAMLTHGLLKPGVNHLPKPFSPELLAQRVRRVLES